MPHNGIGQREARRAQIVTVDMMLASVGEFEAFTGCKDFKAFTLDQAVGFKRQLEACKNRTNGKHLAKATIDGRLRAVKDFFNWLAEQQGYRSRINRADLEYFNLSCLHQDAREMKTKAAKTFTTWFYPVDPVYLSALTAWVAELRTVSLFGPSDPLFPKPIIGRVDGEFKVTGLSRQIYSNAAKVREVVVASFPAVGMPRFHPHSFRSTLVALGNITCRTPEEFKAWSMNLGHDSVVTTMQSYCRVPPSRQRELLKSMSK